MITGECNCGAIGFSLDKISDVFICHCSICRKSTGSAGFAVGVVENEKFCWEKGQENISFWAKPGHEWHTYFCKICGSTLPGENDDMRMYIPVGLLDSGHEALKVAHHVYVNSRAVWEEIGDSGKKHPEGYETPDA